MDHIVADASFIIKLFVKEEYTEDALKIIDSYISGDLKIMVPSLLIYEVLNGIKYSKSKKFGLEEMKNIANAIRDYSFDVIDLGDILNEVIHLSIKYNISIYDATYIAIAFLNNVILYTSDQRLIEAIKSPLIKHIKNFGV